MRKMNYALANGTTVSTMREAKASGQPYTVTFEDIEEDTTANMTELQRARRKSVRKA